MELLKVKHGLLEAENFFLASTFSDFAGSAKVSRDISTGTFKLSSNDKIERAFYHNEFVIEVKKENHNSIRSIDYYRIYVGNKDNYYGIHDDFLDENQYWKLIGVDNYIQAYASKDGCNWSNIGGIHIDGDITYQGFVKNSDEDFTLDYYQVFNNPYLTIQNFNEGTICELYDEDNNLIKTRIFDNNMECKIFLDSHKSHGYLVFKDCDDNILFTSDVIELIYGDVWVYSPYNIEILYLGNVVTNEDPKLLQDLEEVISIKNLDDKAYTNLTIGTSTCSDDTIELSLDGNTYSSTISLDLNQNEEKLFYVKITKSPNNHNFKVRNFQLVVNA